MTLAEVFEQFLRFKNSYCVPKSCLYYRENVQRFLSWLSKRTGCPVQKLHAGMLNETVYRDYLISLRECGIKNTSVNTYIRAVKVFLRWLYEEGWLDSDITQRAKYPRPDPDFVYPLQNQEAARLDRTFDRDSFLGLRDYCIVHLMLDCGLRTGEVVELRWHHVFDGYLQICNSKFNRTRHVPLPDWLQKDLHKLRRMKVCPGCDSVFLERYGRAPITLNTVKQLFAALKVRSGIPRLHAHLLRHTFASSFVYYGGGLELLRILMGHADYATTQNYLHIASQMLICGYDMYKIDDLFFRLPGAAGRR